MAPGNAWHLPGSVELARDLFMRAPLYPTELGARVAVYSGNQFAGDGNAANQLQDESAVRFKQTSATNWNTIPMVFDRQIGNNKYFRADLPLTGFARSAQIEYYLVLAYSDRDTTYIGAANDDATGWASGVLPSENAAQSRPFYFTVGDQNEQKPYNYTRETPEEHGQWTEVFPLPNVGAHATLLRTGEVLFWGRHDNTNQSMNSVMLDGATLRPIQNAATCTPWLFNPASKKSRLIKEPFMPNGAKPNDLLPRLSDGSNRPNANIFCAGHAFRPDGKLVVAGGHLSDFVGLDQCCIYDPETESWEVIPTVKTNDERNGTIMGNGRWYPTAINLPSGAILVVSGSYQRGAETPNNLDTQILTKTVFASVDPDPDRPIDLYPRMHVSSSGIVYWVSLVDLLFLNMTQSPQWQIITTPRNGNGEAVRGARDYACSVMYEQDQILYIGGGNPPQPRVDLLNISNHPNLAWEQTNNMRFARRQHNATVLPDGSILVTGGTRGGGENAVDFPGDTTFNDLRPGQPVHIAELWDPTTRQWKIMASEQIDRCYHATAVLLPDGRVLSAGSGEFQLGQDRIKPPNFAIDSHRDAQIYSPPYLFRGPRPTIDALSSDKIQCGGVFTITTPDAGQITTVCLVGLSTVTHSLNTGQRRSTLTFILNGRTLTVIAPLTENHCPPGYYMLFILNRQGVPSIARFVQVLPTPNARILASEFKSSIVAQNNAPATALQLRRFVRTAADNGIRIEIGITPTCPYGLSACWGAAYEALRNLNGVQRVDPIPHDSGSTASVFLAAGAGLPDLEAWRGQFWSFVRDTYGLRGFEAAIRGKVSKRGEGYVLIPDGREESVALVSLRMDAKIQWDVAKRVPRDASDEEMGQYERLTKVLFSEDMESVLVTGPLSQDEGGNRLQVRKVD